MKIIKFAFLHLIMLLILGCSPEDTPFTPLFISKIGDVDSVSRACATSFVLDNQAFVLMGRKFGEDYLKSVYAYNPESNQWVRKKDFPGKTRVFPVSAVVNNTAYAGLGFNGKQFSNPVLKDSAYLCDWWMYNQSSDTWSRKADFPEKFTNHTISFIYKDEIYVMHGFGVTWLSKSVHKYNPIHDQWIKLNDFPGYARTGAVGIFSGEKYYCGTGFASWNEKDWWEYNPATDQWRKLKSMPDKGRINASVFKLDNRIFVTSGRYLRGEHNGGHLKNDIMEYDINKNVWYSSGEIPLGGRENALSFIINSKAYIAFGEGDLAIIRNDIWSIETN